MSRKMSRKKIQQHYLPRLANHSESFKILDWASAASQQRRFEILAEHVPLAGRSLLDVGCGVGDLYGFLSDRSIEADYTGVDILEDMVTEAKCRNPNGRFECVDIFSGTTPTGATFDVVFCSGTFNLNVGNNLEFLPTAIARLLELTQGTLAFNLLHDSMPGQEKEYAYYDPQKIIELLEGRVSQIRLLDDYLPNDFTIICLK